MLNQEDLLNANSPDRARVRRQIFSPSSNGQRERVYVFAAEGPGKVEDFERAGLRPGELPTGVVVGLVEIVD